MIQGGFLSERKGKVTPCRWTEDRKGAGTNSRESGARSLQARSIRALTLQLYYPDCANTLAILSRLCKHSSYISQTVQTL